MINALIIQLSLEKSIHRDLIIFFGGYCGDRQGNLSLREQYTFSFLGGRSISPYGRGYFSGFVNKTQKSLSIPARKQSSLLARELFTCGYKYFRLVSRKFRSPPLAVLRGRKTSLQSSHKEKD